MARYRLLEDGGVFDNDTKVFIPNNPRNRHWREYQEWLGAGSPPNVPDPYVDSNIPTLPEAIAAAEYDIDFAAEKARNKFNPDGNVQSDVHLIKYQEALDYIAAGRPAIGSPVPVEYLHLVAEATADGRPITAVANTIIARRRAWINNSARIEGVRLGGRKNVSAAGGLPAVAAARAAAIAAIEAL